MLSPFGWGEICYRDFEAALNGMLLIKPDMNTLILDLLYLRMTVIIVFLIIYLAICSMIS